MSPTLFAFPPTLFRLFPDTFAPFLRHFRFSSDSFGFRMGICTRIPYAADALGVLSRRLGLGPHKTSQLITGRRGRHPSAFMGVPTFVHGLFPAARGLRSVHKMTAGAENGEVQAFQSLLFKTRVDNVPSFSS